MIKFAFRNLIRHWRRTILTIIAMTFGLTINFWLDCMLRGRNEEVAKLVTSTFTGHFQIYNKSYFQDKSISSQLNLEEDKIKAIVGDQGDFTARNQLPSLISSGESSNPILLEGVRPQAEKRISNIFQSLKVGEYLSEDSSCSPAEILIGDRLARALKVNVGEKLVILTQASDGSLGNDLFRIKGIYNTGSNNFDKTYAFTHENCAQRLGQIKWPHEFVIKVNEEKNEGLIFEKIKKILSEDQIVVSWKESMPAVARMIKVNNAIMGLVSFILLVVVILGFINTLLMSVLERTREMGMMLAVGMSPLQVQFLILNEALLITAFSSLTAILLGLGIVSYYQIHGFNLAPFVGENFDADQFSVGLIIHPIISLGAFLRVLGFSFLTVILSVLIPARRVSKLSPVEALRSN